MYHSFFSTYSIPVSCGSYAPDHESRFETLKCHTALRFVVIACHGRDAIVALYCTVVSFNQGRVVPIRHSERDNCIEEKTLF